MNNMEASMRKFYEPVEEILMAVDDCQISYNFNISTQSPSLVFSRDRKEIIRLLPPEVSAYDFYYYAKALFYGDINLDNLSDIKKEDYNLIISKIEDKFSISISELTADYINYFN